MKNIEELVSKLTLEEKASLCSGLDFWDTKPIDRLGIPSVMVCDGPNGLRALKDDRSNLGNGVAIKAVCFPTGSALGASFDEELLGRLGSAIGSAAKQEEIHTVLGPAINIKRSPLCGRNFEYISEDPTVAGKLAASYVKKAQEQGVGVCVKHFAANNQEYYRMSTDTIVSERALREIYLAAFERVQKEAKPWSFMCAYNKLNGTYCSENKWLLTKVLREDWGFDGIVITDWGAMNDRVKALEAGLELEMPTSFGIRDKSIVSAVKEGKLDMAVLDEAVRRLLTWIYRGTESEIKEKLSLDEQHEIAKEIALSSAVLLKNEKKTLPLKRDEKVVFIGTFAHDARYQGGGSSHVNSYRVTNALESVKPFADVEYFPGWSDNGEVEDKMRLEEALNASKTADKVVIFAGLPDSFESEGYDRKHIDIPHCQNELIEKVGKLNKNVAVVLFNGSPISMPWLNKVNAVLEMNLAGEAGGEACAELLYGRVNPSGHLAESYPLRLEDNPSYISFPGTSKKVIYREDVFVGYRYYDTVHKEVLFPFGHGLSYTEFALSNPALNERTLTFDITNTGKVNGAEVVQLYIKPPCSLEDRPVHELKDFIKVRLEKGETKRLSFKIDDRMLSYFYEDENEWTYDSGTYILELGFSSRDIKLEVPIKVENKKPLLKLSETTTMKELLAHYSYSELPSFVKEASIGFGMDDQYEQEQAALNKEATTSMFLELPLHSLASFIKVPDDYLEQIRKIIEG